MMFKVYLKESPRDFLKAISVYGSVLCIATAITMFIYYKPGEYAGGMKVAGEVLDYGRRVSGSWYLLGHDNSSFLYIYPLLIIYAVYELVFKGRISKLYYLVYLFVVYAFVFVNSSTAWVSLFLGLIVVFLSEKKEKVLKLFSFINYKTAVLMILAFAILIVYFRLHYMFAFFIQGVLHKSLTLTRRTEIWDIAIPLVAKRPLLGIGLQSDAYNYAFFKVNHVHNVILELLYEGGVFSLICFLCGVVLYCRKMKRFRNSSLFILLSGAVIVYFFNTCLDFYPYTFPPYAILVLCENIDYLTDIRNESHNKYNLMEAE